MSTVTFTTNADGEQRVRIDSPGLAAQSAPITDPMMFIAQAASQLGLEVDDSNPAALVVSVPAGG
jgi:hypothetical protein